MSEQMYVDTRLERFANSLSEATDKQEPRTRQTVQILWQGKTYEQIQKNPFFYKEPTSPPPILTSFEFIDSLKCKNVPLEMIESLSLLDLNYRGFNNKKYRGQIVIHKDLYDSTKIIFDRIFTETDFPLTSLIPLNMFDWKHSASFNNSGAFDWRFVSNSDEISDHAFGAAIDINPLINPWVREGSMNSLDFPYDPNKRGTLHADSDVVSIFKDEGWKWGGDWKNSKDWQHFYRPDIPHKYFGKEEVPE